MQKPTVLVISTHITTDGTELVITRDRISKDFAVHASGEYLGSRETLAGAMTLRNEYLGELIYRRAA